MLVIFIILIVAAIATFICSIVSEEMDGFFGGIIFNSCIILSIILACFMWGKPKPNAIDVYRGRTTLQITYQDSIAIDSVVVFKNREEGL